MNLLFILQYLYIFFFKFKNLYYIYYLKSIYDFLNGFFVRDCLFKYKRFNILFHMIHFSYLLDLPYISYFNIKNYYMFIKSIKFNNFFNSFLIHSISFLSYDLILYRLVILDYLGLAYFQFIKLLRSNSAHWVNFVMLWVYFHDYACLDFMDVLKSLELDYIFEKFDMFSLIFNFLYVTPKWVISSNNWKYYFKINLNIAKINKFFNKFLINLDIENFYVFNINKIFFDFFFKLIYILSIIFSFSYDIRKVHINNNICVLFFFKIFLCKSIKFMWFFRQNMHYYIEED